MKKFLEAVLAKHKHMALKASPHHPHSQALVYTPGGKEVIRPIDTADAGYGGEAVSDAEGGEADPGKASKKAVSPMPMQTLVKAGLDKTKKAPHVKEGFDPEPADIAKMLVAKHGKDVTKDHIRALEQDRDSHSGLDHDEIMKHVKKLQEETERERLMKMRSFAAKNKKEGLGKAALEEGEVDEAYRNRSPGQSNYPGARLQRDHLDRYRYKHQETSQEREDRLSALATGYKAGRWAHGEKFSEEAEQVDELKKSTLASYAKKATDDVSYHSFTAGSMSSKDPERLVHDKKAMKRQAGVEKAVDKMAKEEVELDEISQEARKNKMRTMGVNAAIQHPKKVAFAGGAIQMYRQAVKKLSSKEMSDVAKKLPNVKEENDGTEADQGEYGYEGDMAMSQLKSIIRNAKDLHDHMEPQTDLPEWLQAKITLAADYIQTAADYWRSEKEEVSEGRMKDIATNKAEDERLAARHAAAVLGGPVKPKASVIGGKGQPKSMHNLTSRLATKAMKAGHSVSEEQKKSGKVPRVGEMEKALEEEEVWDKPMPDSKKQGSLSPEQKAKAKARADRAGRTYPNMIDNMWASKQ